MQNIIETLPIEQDQKQLLSTRFEKAQETLAEWSEKALAIVVTEESDTKGMALAKQARLLLRTQRTEVEKTRTALKERSLQEGRAIDQVAKFFTEKIQTLECHLQEQEEFAMRMEQARRDSLEVQRIATINTSGLLSYVNSGEIDLGVVSDEMFEAFVQVLENRRAEDVSRREQAAREQAEAEERRRAEQEELRRLREEAKVRELAARLEQEKRIELEKAQSRKSDSTLALEWIEEMEEMLDNMPNLGDGDEYEIINPLKNRIKSLLLLARKYIEEIEQPE